MSSGKRETNQIVERPLFPGPPRGRGKFFAILLVTAALAPSRLMGQEVGLRATAPQKELRIGEPVHITIHLRSSVEIDSIGPLPADSSGMFEILSIRRGEGGETWDVEAMTIDTGTVFLAPIKFGYVVKGDSLVRTAYANSLAFHVPGIEIGEGADIKDIKPPLSAPWGWEDVWPYTAAIALIAAVWYWWRRRNAKRRAMDAVAEPEPDIPPHVRALRELRELEEKKLWQKGHIKEYYSECTEIVRRFFEGRWEVPALELTTDDILDALRRRESEAKHIDSVRTFLTIADLVKFAKTQPTPADHERELASAYEIVRSMTPSPRTVEEEHREETVVAG